MARIKVTAGEGRTVPVPSSIATAPGAALLYLKPGDELEVDESNTHVQRMLGDGDFVRLAAVEVELGPDETKES